MQVVNWPLSGLRRGGVAKGWEGGKAVVEKCSKLANGKCIMLTLNGVSYDTVRWGIYKAAENQKVRVTMHRLADRVFVRLLTPDEAAGRPKVC